MFAFAILFAANGTTLLLNGHSSTDKYLLWKYDLLNQLQAFYMRCQV